MKVFILEGSDELCFKNGHEPGSCKITWMLTQECSNLLDSTNATDNSDQKTPHFISIALSATDHLKTCPWHFR